MSNLVFVRHAQASFFSENYDQLSDLGKRQARSLGKYWASQGVAFDAVYCGPCARHLDTAKEASVAFQQRDLTWPEPQILHGLDEHQVDELVAKHTVELAKRSTLVAQLIQRWTQAATPSDKQRTFQQLFEVVAEEWLTDGGFPIESWPSFQSRVNAAIDRIVHQTPRGSRVAVFSSVGPISVALQRALETTDSVTLRTGWSLRNASLTNFLFSGSRFTLESFNALPHLEPEAWTYR